MAKDVARHPVMREFVERLAEKFTKADEPVVYAPSITLRQLRYLGALAQHRHFGRAAEACAVTQPALSMQIRDLEQELGVELVERRQGEVALTTLGIEVAQRAESVVAATRDLVDFARHRGRLLTGRLQLGVIPTLAPYVLPKILPALQRLHPELRIELRETQTKTLLDELIRGTLDAVMLALPAGEAEIEFAKTGATRQEVEFTVRNVDPGVNFTFVIDGIDVASATSNQRGRADVELDVRMP